jgi:hypothetical protein
MDYPKVTKTNLSKVAFSEFIVQTKNLDGLASRFLLAIFPFYYNN